MSYCWSDVMKTVLPEGKHKVDFHAFCDTCGLEVKPCTFCYTRPEFMQNGYCRECWNNYHPIHGFRPVPAEVPRFLCQDCQKWEDYWRIYGWCPLPVHKHLELVGFGHKPACKCCPLSSTNYMRFPYIVPVISNLPPTPLWKRQVRAYQFFKKELDDTKVWAQALIVYTAFFRTAPPNDADANKKFLTKVEKLMSM